MTVKYHNTYKIPSYLVTYLEYDEINYNQTDDEIQQADDFMAEFDGPVNNAQSLANTLISTIIRSSNIYAY